MMPRASLRIKIDNVLAPVVDHITNELLGWSGAVLPSPDE
jgi:hypothetical protein